MLKKKNIAMVMAAATVATSVAPVFALEQQNMDKEALIKEVEAKLAQKYTDEDLGSVYEIKATASGSAFDANTKVTSITQFKGLLEKVEIAGEGITVEITDKGHATVDGKVVDKVKGTAYSKAELFAIDNSNAAIKTVTRYNATGVHVDTTNEVDASNITKIVVALESGVELVLDETCAKLDLNKGLDKDKKEINLTDADAETAKRVESFEVDTTGNPTTTAKLAGRNISKIVCDETSKTLNFNLTDFITETGYTQAGKELVELLGDANSDVAGSKQASVIKDGKKYVVTFDQNGAGNLGIVAVKDAGYKMNIDLQVVEGTNTSKLQLVVKSNVQKELVDLKAQIKAATSSTDITVGKFAKLAGDDRFETAVEISKDAYNGKEAATDTAKAVVLVGENAVVDGLASAPLAKSANAPILLTKKDNIPASTMNEIKRLVEKGSKIYLVGGKNTISKEVEAQLIKEINANIVRLAGNDRYETSLEIAEELDTVKVGNLNKAFVVGGNGLADAMSVAAVAANAQEPIIVTPKEGLTKDAKAFLNKTTSIVDADVIGGESNVSTQVLKDLIGTTNIPVASDVVRVSGKDRNDTNAEVLAKYFPSTGKLTNVYVAKDADAQLVDALAVAPLAGETATGAIVLATNDLTAAQEKAIKTAKHATATENKTTQIGNGVATTVMQKVLKALGL